MSHDHTQAPQGHEIDPRFAMVGEGGELLLSPATVLLVAANISSLTEDAGARERAERFVSRITSAAHANGFASVDTAMTIITDPCQDGERQKETALALCDAAGPDAVLDAAVEFSAGA